MQTENSRSLWLSIRAHENINTEKIAEVRERERKSLKNKFNMYTFYFFHIDEKVPWLHSYLWKGIVNKELNGKMVMVLLFVVVHHSSCSENAWYAMCLFIKLNEKKTHVQKRNISKKIDCVYLCRREWCKLLMEKLIWWNFFNEELKKRALEIGLIHLRGQMKKKRKKNTENASKQWMKQCAFF